MGMLDALIFGVRNLFSNGAELPLVSDVNYKGALRATYNAQTDAVDVDLSAAPPLGAASATSLTFGAQPLPNLGPAVVIVTTDDTSTPVPGLTFSVPPGKTLAVTILAIANLGVAGTPNANFGGTVYQTTKYVTRIGAGAPASGSSLGVLSPNAPFTALNQGVGAVNVALVGNTLVVSVQGFPVPLPWATATIYREGDGNTAPGEFVTSSGGVWLCDSGGTTSGSAPSGTGTGIGTGATFTYTGPGSNVVVTWTLFVNAALVG